MTINFKQTHFEAPFVEPYFFKLIHHDLRY